MTKGLGFSEIALNLAQRSEMLYNETKPKPNSTQQNVTKKKAKQAKPIQKKAAAAAQPDVSASLNFSSVATVSTSDEPENNLNWDTSKMNKLTNG